ncbi:conserved hypothetical protein [Ricinus communis]|uniref:RNase H type-1 domain-containing protein n=1 Tax=Ricinus communis TaxID=3988 RepID=B9S5X8_RICCO|nr:conserved hypothetical protein [Ricinus communis]
MYFRQIHLAIVINDIVGGMAGVGEVGMISLSPPRVGWVKLNTDGCSKGCKGVAGGGGSLRDRMRQCLFDFYHPK